MESLLYVILLIMLILLIVHIITTASLPLRYEIENLTGASGNATLKQICSTVISERWL